LLARLVIMPHVKLINFSLEEIVISFSIEISEIVEGFETVTPENVRNTFSTNIFEQ